ncbi:MAG: phosphotransferase family protein [Deltaproteobacteria bacterium]|nr:phosphotransferase family protein [Deltaproteobacteria bacterium]
MPPAFEKGAETIDPAALRAWLLSRMPASDELEVGDLLRPGAGESSDTQLFEARWREAGQERALSGVLRCAPRRPGPFPSYDLAMQFEIMRTLGERTAVPVPEVIWLEEDPAVLGAPFLIMRQVEGDAPIDFPSYQGQGMYRDASPELRAHMWCGTVEAVAELHAQDWRGLGVNRVPGARAGDDPARQQLDTWRGYLAWVSEEPGEHLAVFHEALAWLEARHVPSVRLSLCWGDAKLGNVLYRPGSRDVGAILDWEMATIGDPEMDIASLHLSDLRAQDGAESVALEGTPSADELVRMYEKTSGHSFRDFHYALVFATFWRGAVQVKVMSQLRARGADIPDALFVDNFPVRTLCRLLRLPQPG